MSHPVRYADSGGLSIAYQVFGAGDPTILLIPGFLSHLDFVDTIPGFARLRDRLSALGTLVLFDKRGTGLSDRDFGSGTLEERVDDIRAVLDDVGVASVHIVGLSEGGPLSLLYAASHPSQVESLSVLGSFVLGPLAPDFPSPEAGAEFAARMLSDIDEDWGSGAFIRRFVHAPPEAQDVLARFERSASTPATAHAILEANLRIDARGVLSSVAAPVLIVHNDRDVLTPVAAGRAMQKRLPDAVLDVIEDAEYHVSWHARDMDRYADAVERFITGSTGRATQVQDRILATVLFTDIVGSTARAVAEGDDVFRVKLNRFETISREETDRFRGHWVRSTGDGALATFDGPARAIEAARSMRQRLQPLDLPIRAGIHTGEVEMAGDGIGGLAVHLAARVMDLAADGEVWVSPTVPGLVVGSGIDFETRGAFELKGISGEWQLSAVV